MFRRTYRSQRKSLHCAEAFSYTLKVVDDLAMLNDASGGKSWLEHGVKFEQILKRNAKTKEGSQVLWEYALKHIFQPNIDKGNIMV